MIGAAGGALSTLGSGMRRRIFAVVMVAGLVLGLAGVWPGRAAASTGVTFSLSIKSAFLRAQPDLAAMRSYSVFQGRAYGVSGRTAASDWLLLDFAGAAGGDTWIPLSFGVVSGSLELVPVVNPSFVPAAATPTFVPASETAPKVIGEADRLLTQVQI